MPLTEADVACHMIFLSKNLCYRHSTVGHRCRRVGFTSTVGLSSLEAPIAGNRHSRKVVRCCWNKDLG
ncbi:hypothetical protein GQ457_04G008400 [Hibiscus cannabinus]